MEFVILNAFLYIATLGIYYRKVRKVMDAGFILIATYAIIAIICIFEYALNPTNWQLTILPFLFLFAICLLSFRPYLKYQSSNIYKKLLIRKPNLLLFFCWVFIVSALLVIFFNFSTFEYSITEGNWATLYRDHFDRVKFTSQVERYIRIFVQYSTPFFICSLFYYLTLDKRNIIFSIILFISIFFTSFGNSIVSGTRGEIALLFIFLVLGYTIFYKYIPKRRRKTIYTIGIIGLCLVLVYTLAVTESRFGGREIGANKSLLYYFGHSMLTFDYGLADSINKFMLGDYILKTNADLYIHGFDTVLGTHLGTQFYTFVGAWYLDFGPIGTLLIALILPWLLFGYWNRRNHIDFADLYLYFFYLKFLVNGVFVIGQGYYITWIMAIVIFILLKAIKL